MNLPRMRALWRGRPRARDAARRRLAAALRREELRGLSFAFQARWIAGIAVGAFIIATVNRPQAWYYLSVVVLLLILGAVPFLLRRHPLGQPARLAFIVLDVAVITMVIMADPPFMAADPWPIQMRLRGQEFIYCLVYLAASALSFSPVVVAWTGAWITVLWSAGVLMVLQRSDTLTAGDIPAGGPMATLSTVLNPAYVSLGQWRNQVVLTLIATALLTAAVWRARSTLLRLTQAEVTRAELSRYVSPDLADAMVRTPDQDLGRPQLRQVAVIFADIVGFTGHAEDLPPERVVALLRSFHARTCKVVFAHSGTLDKFLGDGFMATFGALADDPDAARKALACALALQAECERWRAKRHARGAPEIAVAVGVHVGPVVVGNIGAERRLEFTAIGDPVNVASRLERLTRDHGCRIAASRELLEAAGPLPETERPFAARGSVAIRGRTQPIDLFVWPAAAPEPALPA
ncbi:MAG TPA: adenylate/guanylate cyclase domain-containing protein [Beijerinckiaceae bacterium]